MEIAYQTNCSSLEKIEQLPLPQASSLKSQKITESKKKAGRRVVSLIILFYPLQVTLSFPFHSLKEQYDRLANTSKVPTFSANLPSPPPVESCLQRKLE
jgi:hypothetical protein